MLASESSQTWPMRTARTPRRAQVLDKEHPDGVQHTFKMNRDPLNRSVLQQHVDFFDDDGKSSMRPRCMFLRDDCYEAWSRSHSTAWVLLSSGSQ